MSNSSNVKSLRAMVAEEAQGLKECEGQAAEIRGRIEILNQAIEKMGGSKPAKRGRPAGTAPAKRGRPVGSKNGSATVGKLTKKPKKRSKNAMPMHRLVCEILSKYEDGIKLKEVVRQVVASGYKTEAKTPIAQMVSQALWKLKTDGNNVVVRTDGALYKLNIKAA
jgi:hemin uptake protein HemP